MLHPVAGAVDIDPIPDRMVFLLSRAVAHEVLATQRPAPATIGNEEEKEEEEEAAVTKRTLLTAWWQGEASSRRSRKPAATVQRLEKINGNVCVRHVPKAEDGGGPRQLLSRNRNRVNAISGQRFMQRMNTWMNRDEYHERLHVGKHNNT